MVLKNDQKNLDDFLKKNDIASWYQGMSPYQEESVRSLTGDLRDDFEQGSAYRVENCLIRLGVSPVISKKKIQTMVKLSRGNALAFTFFILEGYYKSFNKNCSYSSNELILMTTISKLDILDTLRELDRILPPGHISKKDQLKKENMQRMSVKEIPAKPLQKTTKPKKNPYFERQPRPKQINVKMTCTEQDFVVAFAFWPLNQPPNYGPVTDPPWFTDYKLRPAARVVKQVVEEAVDAFLKMKEEEAAYRRSSNLERLGWRKKPVLPPKTDDEPQLCGYHKFLKEQADLLRDELTVIARDRCLEMIDVSFRVRKNRRERIISQLEHDIDRFMEKYNNTMKMGHTKLHVLSNPSCILCKAVIKTPVPNKSGKALVGLCEDLAHTDVLQTYKGKRLTGGGLRVEDVDFDGDFQPCKATLMRRDVDICMQPDKDKSKRKHTNEQTARISFGSDSKKKQTGMDVRFAAKQTRKIFFKAAGDNKPYHFKFKRVFKSGRKEVADVEKHIKDTFIRALDKPESCTWEPIIDETGEEEEDGQLLDICRSKLTDSSNSSDNTSDHSKYSHIDHKQEIVDAVVRCAKEMWKKRVAIKRAEMEREERLAAMNKIEDDVLKYDMDYFDADDTDLMDRMLKDGINELRKNQRYVLASLPDSHKLPVLREWIKRRYGKKYTNEELRENIKTSAEIFETVMFLQTNPPEVDMMGMNEGTESFAAYDQAMKLAKKIKAAYHENLNSVFMNQIISCWYAMGNYLCPGGPPKKTFYAYLPATHRDILRYHVWNGECRNYRQLREMVRSRRKENEK